MKKHRMIHMAGLLCGLLLLGGWLAGCDTVQAAELPEPIISKTATIPDGLELTEELKAEIQEHAYSAYWNTAPRAAGRTVDCDIWNLSEPGACKIQLVYFLPDSNETIFKSDILAPGETADEDALEKDLPAGTYDVIVTLNVLSPSTGDIISTFDGNMQLTVG